MDKTESFTLSDLTFSQKLNLMETIWDEITTDDKQLESPDWHKDILNDRENALESGKAKFSDWEEAKERIRRKVL